MDLARVTILCLVATLFNIPFGFYRMGVRKYSWRWFLAIHLPIPFVVLMRWGLGIGLWAIPLVLVFAVIGQLAGGRLRKK